MAFFDNFTTSLKQRWLQFFQVNSDWIRLHMEVESVYTPDGGRRPPSYLILGVVNALEPKLAQLMLPFSRLNPDADTLIEVLDLNFDPDLALGNRFIPQPEIQEAREDLPVAFDQQAPEQAFDVSELDAFGEDLDNPVVVVESHEETIIIMEDVGEELSDMSLDDLAEPMLSVETADTFSEISFDNQGVSADDAFETLSTPDDAFVDMSFDELNDMAAAISDVTATEGISDDEVLESLNPTDEGNFGVLEDVWGNEMADQTGEANNENFLGEDLQSDDDDSEISRLFPNI